MHTKMVLDIFLIVHQTAWNFHSRMKNIKWMFLFIAFQDILVWYVIQNNVWLVCWKSILLQFLWCGIKLMRLLWAYFYLIVTYSAWVVQDWVNGQLVMLRQNELFCKLYPKIRLWCKLSLMENVKDCKPLKFHLINFFHLLANFYSVTLVLTLLAIFTVKSILCADFYIASVPEKLEMLFKWIDSGKQNWNSAKFGDSLVFYFTVFVDYRLHAELFIKFGFITRTLAQI